jgi:hypothetical protein
MTNSDLRMSTLSLLLAVTCKSAARNRTYASSGYHADAMILLSNSARVSSSKSSRIFANLYSPSRSFTVRIVSKTGVPLIVTIE